MTTHDTAALVAALEETQGLLAAMLHEVRPADEIKKQIFSNRRALVAETLRQQQGGGGEMSLDLLLRNTGSSSIEDLCDMAIVGHSLMSRIDTVASEPGPYKGWTPAEDPSEIVLDLYNDLIEAAEAERDRLYELLTQAALAGEPVNRACGILIAEGAMLPAGPAQPLAGKQEGR